jgi:hypothetical protein
VYTLLAGIIVRHFSAPHTFLTYFSKEIHNCMKPGGKPLYNSLEPKPFEAERQGGGEQNSRIKEKNMGEK